MPTLVYETAGLFFVRHSVFFTRPLLCGIPLLWYDLRVWSFVSAYIYRVSQEERAKLRDGVPYVKLYRYNPKHLYPKLNGYGDNGK